MNPGRVPSPIELDLPGRFSEREKVLLGPYATPSSASVRRRPLTAEATDFRTAFSIDADRILHSQAFTRYIDKTQVFSLVENDNITRRVIHIQLLSKIARTIGRVLRLNEDLIEAIALGHDIGHCPFGHPGERILSQMCTEHRIGSFQHNLQSLHTLDRIERGGGGLNLSLQVLDGIVCHDGETHIEGLRPEPSRSFADLAHMVERRKFGEPVPMNPMTMEGCVVKLCDTISYIGRDLEDAIKLKLVSRSDIPADIVRILGDTNGRIVYSLVESLIVNSLDQDTLKYDPRVGNALRELKAFNYRTIYRHPRVRREEDKLEHTFRLLFHRLLEDLSAGREESPVFEFLKDMNRTYQDEMAAPEKVRDYIAGMTDDYFIYTFNRVFVPEKLPRRLR